MAVQLSTDVRSAMLDAFESATGATAILKIRTGAQPATCATADSGTALCSITLPADWMNAGSGGTKTKLGTWEGAATATGTAAHFRIYESTGVTCKMQGAITGDLSLTNTTITALQTVRITVFTLTAGNA